MADLATLHRDLLSALDEIEHLIAQPTLDNLRLSRVRLYISKVAGERRNKVDKLCRELTQGAAADYAAMIEALRVSNIEARLEYTHHIGAWSLQRVAEDWPGYCVASTEIARRFRQQVALEQALLGVPATETADPLALSDPRGYMGRQLPNQDIGAPHGYSPRSHLR
jgi:hypothetical protein